MTRKEFITQFMALSEEIGEDVPMVIQRQDENTGEYIQTEVEEVRVGEGIDDFEDAIVLIIE